MDAKQIAERVVREVSELDPAPQGADNTLFVSTGDLLLIVEEAAKQLCEELWQPIETAPKDGTDVLLRRNDERFVARWIRSEAMGPVWATPDGYVIFRATEWASLLPLPPKGPQS